MEMKYTFNEDGSIKDVTFEGLNGLEYVTSTKDALNVMKIVNPAVTFRNGAEAGLYNSMTDDEYSQALDTVKCIRDLWRYPGEPGDSETKYEMSILMLLANAIEAISRQDVEIRKYKGEW